MIKVTVELWPHGYSENKKTLGICYIANDGTGSPSRGNYGFSLRAKTMRSLRHGKVENFPRKSKNAWHLLQKVLDSAL